MKFIVESHCGLRSINILDGRVVLPTKACGHGVQLMEPFQFMVVGGTHPVYSATSLLRISQLLYHLRDSFFGGVEIVLNVMESALYDDYIRLPAFTQWIAQETLKLIGTLSSQHARDTSTITAQNLMSIKPMSIYLFRISDTDNKQIRK